MAVREATLRAPKSMFDIGAPRVVQRCEPDADAVECVLARLKRVCRNTSLDFALHVGSIIIHHFYAGSTDSWRARGPKTTSFRRLAEHPDLPMSPGALYRCVALFELCDRLNAASRWRNLGASHLRAVLGLPPELQEKLLSHANGDGWTVATLDSEVRKHKGTRKARGGRRPRPPLVMGLSRVQQSIEQCYRSLDPSSEYERQQLQTSARAIAEAQEWLDKLATMVSHRLRDSSLPPPDDQPVHMGITEFKASAGVTR